MGVVGDQDLVDSVVAGRCAVQPVALVERLVVAHLDVLDVLFAVVLGEDAVDACLHASRRRSDLDGALVDRVELYAVFLEQVHEVAEVCCAA